MFCNYTPVQRKITSVTDLKSLHVSAYVSFAAVCEVLMQFSMFSGSQLELKQCHYLVDLATETEAPREPRYAANKEEWSIIAEKPFLDTTRQVFMCGVWTFLKTRGNLLTYKRRLWVIHAE